MTSLKSHFRSRLTQSYSKNTPPPLCGFSSSSARAAADSIAWLLLEPGSDQAPIEPAVAVVDGSRSGSASRPPQQECLEKLSELLRPRSGTTRPTHAASRGFGLHLRSCSPSGVYLVRSVIVGRGCTARGPDYTTMGCPVARRRA